MRKISEAFTDVSTRTRNSFFAVGNTDLSDKMVSHATDRKLLLAEPFTLLEILVQFWRDNRIDSFHSCYANDR
jgi:hypothetical protein